MIEHNNDNRAISFFCVATIVVTILTQVPVLSRLVRPVMYVMWIILFSMGIVQNRFKMPLNGFLKLYVTAVLLLALECFLLFDTHSDSYAFQVVPLPL